MFTFSSIKSDFFTKSLLKYSYKLKTNDILAGQIIGLERKHALVHMGINRSTLLSTQKSFVNKLQAPNEIFSTGDIGEFLIKFFYSFDKKIIVSIVDLYYFRLWQRYKQLDLNTLIFYGTLKLEKDEKILKKGKIITYDGLEVFIPNVHLPKYYKRQRTSSVLLPLKTLELKTLNKTYSIIASCRLAILKKQSLALKVGNIYQSTVLNIKPFGLFVIINGIKCLLHISEISKERIPDIFQCYKIGDQLQVKIIYMNTDQGKIAVSAKQLYN
jgi:small subunit ribosomal protein S1